MASAPYRALKGAIESYCRSHDNCGATHRGHCFEIPTMYEGLGKFPPIEVIFRGQRTWWNAAGYLYRQGQSTRWCYAFDDDGPGANTVLGAAWMIQHEVIFDLPRNQVGVADANCPLFTERPKHNTNEANVRVQVPVPSVTPGRVQVPVPSVTPGDSGVEQVPAEKPSAFIGNIAVAGVLALLAFITLGALIVRWCRKCKQFTNSSATEAEASVDKSELLLPQFGS